MKNVKKVLASFLVFAIMLPLSTPVMAIEDVQSILHSEVFNYMDDRGDYYHGIYTYGEDSVIVDIFDEDDNLISRAERKHGSDYIIETTYTDITESRTENQEEKTNLININDIILPVSEETNSIAPASVEIEIPGSTSYESNGFYNTDYLYQGFILKGEAFFRQTGNVSEYNRVSYSFVRGVTLNVIIVVLTGYYGFLTKAAIGEILRNAGVGLIGAAITTDWEFNGCVNAYEYQFKCEMEYNGRNVVMSLIERDLEYLIVEDEKGNVTSFTFDDYSYSSPSNAIDFLCSEAVGYAAKAFYLKYITGYQPSLPLPVDGPVY